MHTAMVHGGWLAVSWPAIVRASWAKCRRHHVLSSAFFLWVCMYICRFPAACEMFAATRSRFYSLNGAFSLNYRQQCVLQHRVQVSVRHRPIPTDPCGVHALVQCSAQFLFCCMMFLTLISSTVLHFRSRTRRRRETMTQNEGQRMRHEPCGPPPIVRHRILIHLSLSFSPSLTHSISHGTGRKKKKHFPRQIPFAHDTTKLSVYTSVKLFSHFLRHEWLVCCAVVDCWPLMMSAIREILFFIFFVNVNVCSQSEYK